MDRKKTTARRDDNRLGFVIWCVLYYIFEGSYFFFFFRYYRFLFVWLQPSYTLLLDIYWFYAKWIYFSHITQNYDFTYPSICPARFFFVVVTVARFYLYPSEWLRLHSISSDCSPSELPCGSRVNYCNNEIYHAPKQIKTYARFLGYYVGRVRSVIVIFCLCATGLHTI